MAKLIDITGKAISGEWGTDDLVGNGVPVLRTTNFTNIGVVNFNNVVTRQIVKKSISEKLLRYGDIIIEKSGGSDKQPVGRVVFFEGEDNKYLFNNFTGLLRVRDFCKWNPKYIFYSLFANYAKGGTIPFENRTTGLHNLQTDSYVNSVMIVERKIEEQTGIVTILDKVNQLINYEKKQLEDLDILVKSRFVEMFGDLNSNEKNWGKESLKHHAKVIVGYPFKSKDYTETGIRIVGGYNLMQGYVVWSECKYWERIDGYEKYLLEADDIVMAMDRPWVNGGFKISKIDGRELPALLIQRTACIRAIDIEQDYLYMLLNSDCFAEHCNIKGSLVPHISNKDIDSFEIFIPPHELQMEFAYFIKQVDKSKLAIQQSLDELETLKKSLMQQYFG